ncbi:helix-turn-helix domain-containing protein [Eubacteriaceae bacterium ES3]|nr:helix-turn-helix domain-containing protein [Eubacteriaceae bacterium ES3]
MEHLTIWNNDLKEMLHSGKDLETFFSHLSDLINMPYFLFDDNNQIRLSSKKNNLLEYKDTHLHKRVSELLEDPEYRAMISHKDVYLFPQKPFKERFLCFNIFDKSNLTLRLLLQITDSPDAPSPGLVQLFRIFSQSLEKAFNVPSGISVRRHQDDQLHLLINKLLYETGSYNSETVCQILNPFYWKPDHLYQLVCLQFFEGSTWDTSISYVCNQLEASFPHSCAVRFDNDILLINNLTLTEPNANKNFLSHLSPLIRDYTCKAGISDSFNSLLHLKSYHKQALKALHIGHKLHPDFWCYQFSDFKLSYLRHKLTEDFSAEMLMPPGFQTLLISDFKNHSEYVKTLSAYLEKGNNISAAAESLFIHRTTFIRRLERIEKLSGLNLADPRTIFWIGLSLFILEEKT